MKTLTKIIIIVFVFIIVLSGFLVTNVIIYNYVTFFTGRNIPTVHISENNEIYVTPENVIMKRKTYSDSVKLIIGVPYSNYNGSVKVYNNGYYQGVCKKSNYSWHWETYTKLLNLNLYEEGENYIQINGKHDEYINSFTIIVDNFIDYQNGPLSNPYYNTINVSLQYQNDVLCFDTRLLVINEKQQVNFSVSPYLNVTTCRWYKNGVLYSENLSTSVLSQTNYTMKVYINSTYTKGFSINFPVTVIEK